SLRVPLGIGTMFWGDTRLDERMAGHIIPDDTLARVRDRAHEAGVTFFDTAEGYGVGSSEERLARLGFVQPGNLIATKFLPTLGRWSPRAFVRATDASNRRLGQDECALSFIHSPVHPRSPAVWVRGAAQAMRAGKLRALGVSNFDAEQVHTAWAVAQKEGIPLAANQLMVSLLVYDSTELQETMAACHELGIAVVGYGALGQGLLTATLTPERLAASRIARRLDLSAEDLDPLREAIRAAADQHDKSMAQVCLQWVRSKGVIPLVGTRTVEQLEDTLGALEFSLLPDEIARLDDAAFGGSTLERPLGQRARFLVFLSGLIPGVKLARAVGRLRSGSS
ncbi:MAG: aldo/keto reductase, partial [Candidatus Bipolaricaulia bacterium]